VESVCVNGRDEAEVASQAAQRDLIWKHAEAVIVCCGDEGNRLDLGSGLFARLGAGREVNGVDAVRAAFNRGDGEEDEAGMRHLANTIRAVTGGATFSEMQNLELLLGEHRIALKDCDVRMTCEQPANAALQSDECTNKKATL
jgi:hypothetical protein